MTIRFLGVWDTVGAMGIPEVIPGSDWFNREYDYHDPSLDAFVAFARHAVAIDERREFFPVILFDDVDKLNSDRGFVSADLDRKSVVEGKSVSVRVGLGGSRSIKKKYIR